MKFKAPIEVQAGISDGDPTNPLGISGYLLSSDGSNVNWVSPGELSAETAEAIVQPIKANEALVKGDPLYIVGYQSGQNVNIVAKADSSDVAKMPVVGLADDDYANQAFGTMTAFGSFNGDFDTTGGTEGWAIGDIIFVKPGGGLTNIKPGGTDLIQNIAIVSRVNSQTGELEVIALGRTNDVPNLPEGRLFVGTAANTSLISDVVYVDDANDRVGIGTNSPARELEVTGTGNVYIRVTAPTSTDSSAIELVNTAETWTIRNQDTNDNALEFSSDGGTKVTMVRTGNVGIGTTNPSTDLEVSSTGVNGVDISQSASNASQSGRLFFTTNTASEGFALFNSNGTFQVNSGGIPNNTSGTNRISIVGSSGNVGIGTTSPSSKLHIEDSISNGSLFKITTSTSGSLQPVFDARIESNGDTYYDLNNYKSATKKIQIKSSNTSYIQQVDGTGGFDIKGHLKTSLQTVNGGGVLQLHRYGALSLNNDDAYAHTPSSALYINTFSNTSTDYLMLLANQGSDKLAVDLNGNVGIGTTSPSEKLEVSGGNIKGDGLIQVENASDNNIIGKLIIDYGSSNNPILSSVGGTKIDFQTDLVIRSNKGLYSGTSSSTGLIIGSQRANTPIKFLTSPTTSLTYSEAMRIAGDGNVGIGTTSPRTKLHVAGLTGDDDPALGSSTGAVFVSNTATSYGLNVGVNNVGASWLQSQSNTSATAYEMSLNPLGGNVGVGQINPSKKLDVNGSLGCTSFEMGNLKMLTAFGSIFINGTTSGNTIFYGAPASFTQNLQVNGTVTCVNLVQTSQTDKKKDISNIDKSKAKTIQFKEYKYKEGDGDRKRYGVLVEDLENDYPELVHVGADGVKGINYIDLLVKRVAELEKELEDISLTPGPKGDTGATGATGATGPAGANGSNGKNGADGNSHLSNVTSIAFNPKANRLEVKIGGTVYNFAPSK